jgi:hypothetical protein
VNICCDKEDDTPPDCGCDSQTIKGITVSEEDNQIHRLEIKVK